MSKSKTDIPVKLIISSYFLFSFTVTQWVKLYKLSFNLAFCSLLFSLDILSNNKIVEFLPDDHHLVVMWEMGGYGTTGSSGSMGMSGTSGPVGISGFAGSSGARGSSGGIRGGKYSPSYNSLLEWKFKIN